MEPYLNEDAQEESISIIRALLEQAFSLRAELIEQTEATAAETHEVETLRHEVETLRHEVETLHQESEIALRREAMNRAELDAVLSSLKWRVLTRAMKIVPRWLKPLIIWVGRAGLTMLGARRTAAQEDEKDNL